MDFLDLLVVMSGVHDLTLEYFMPTNYAGFFSLLLFTGGLVFWFIVMFLAVVGVFRGIRRTLISARELFSSRRVETAE